MSQIIPPPPTPSLGLATRSSGDRSIDASQASQLLTDPRLPDVIDALGALVDRVARGELVPADGLSTIAALQAKVENLSAERTYLGRTTSFLRRQLMHQLAERMADRGVRTIALFGAGRHTEPYVEQPWRFHGIRVAAVLDDNPQAQSMGNVPIVKADQLAEPIDAVVVSSDAHEELLSRRAHELFDPLGLPVFRIYRTDLDAASHEDTVSLLVDRFGLNIEDATWLYENRGERHDATLPMLPTERTELHLRRYRFACACAAGRRVLDAACGTGYGSEMLATNGKASRVTGVDIDARAVDYATRRHNAGGGASFRVSDATRTSFEDQSFDLVVSFETVEHVEDPDALLAEFCRVLHPSGSLVISTPNDTGLTKYHKQSFTRERFENLLRRWFHRVDLYGQYAGDWLRRPSLPIGIEQLDQYAGRPEYLLAIASIPAVQGEIDAD